MYLKITVILSLLFTTATTSSIQKHKIASIPEASGVSYCKDSDTIIVANDEGRYYEIAPKGEILASYRLGDYDLEGVVCGEKELIFAVEKGMILKVNRKTQKIKELKLKGNTAKISKKHGIEGITKVGNLYYLTIQSKKKKNAKILIVKLGENYAKVTDTIHHKIIDSAGMEYHQKRVYIISDKKDKLYIYNLKQHKIIKKIKLPKFAGEGVTFDKDDNIYFADDDGAVFRYKKRELNIP